MRPFSGIRIIDCTHFIAGPYATYQLGLLGAEVIRVENPLDPDQSRTRSPEPALAAALMGTSFMTQAANKKSLNLNLKTEAGREVLRRLAATADVMVENFRPGAMEGIGLGYSDMREINPRLIYVSISAFGQKGPRREQTASDHIIQAASGLMAATGTPDTAPMITGAALTDYATGMVGAFAVSSALLLRHQTGKGQHVDVAMCDVAMALLSNHAVSFLRHGKEPKPNGNNFDRATIGAYETKDGLVMLAAVSASQQRRLWTVLGRPDLIKVDDAERYASRESDAAVLAAIMLTRTADEWEDFLQGNHVPATRIRTVGEAVNDPHTQARGFFQRVADIPGVSGEMRLPLAPFRMDDGDARIDSPPPRMGEHTDDILAELGFSFRDVEEMRKQRVFGDIHPE